MATVTGLAVPIWLPTHNSLGLIGQLGKWAQQQLRGCWFEGEHRSFRCCEKIPIGYRLEKKSLIFPNEHFPFVAVLTLCLWREVKVKARSSRGTGRAYSGYRNQGVTSQYSILCNVHVQCNNQLFFGLKTWLCCRGSVVACSAQLYTVQ